MEYGLVVVWLVAYAALAALALPATAALFSRFPRRGAGFALPVALAVFGLVGFWVGRIRFGYVTLVAGLGVLAAMSAAALYRGVEIDRRGYLETMAVFAVAFLFLVAIRALDPAVHPGGGEKFLDFGLLSSLARSTQLPPEDVWFAGAPVQYYYGGHAIASLLGDLTVTDPRYAYNLALAGFYGTFVTAAYSLAGAIADDRGRSRRSAGLFAAFFVGVASNLVTPARLVVWLTDSAAWFRNLDANGFGVDDLLGSATATGPGEFDYWSPHLVIEGTNNEFPLFAYLNGDLHAHMMNMGFVLLIAAVGYAYWKTPRSDLRRRRVLVFGVSAALAGLVAVVNTWSFPTVLGLVWIAVLFAPTPPTDLLLGNRSGEPDPTEAPAPDGGLATRASAVVDPGAESVSLRGELVRVVAALVVAAAVAVVAVVVVFPYTTGTTGGRGLGIVADGSSIAGLVLVHGAFLALTVAFLVPRVDPGDWEVRAVAGLLLVALAGLGWSFQLPAAIPFALVVLLGWARLRTDGDLEAFGVTVFGSDGEVGYETALAVGAVGIVVLAEFFFVSGRGNPNRYNTVFKTYTDVWLLWGTASAVVLAEYADPAALFDRVRGVGGDRSASGGNPVSLGGVLAAVLVVSLSLYGAFALAGHVEASENRGPATLDSLEFVDRHHSKEAGAIRFLREKVEGQPNIVTAPTLGRDMYEWSADWQIPPTGDQRLVGGSAPASLSGVPTLLGWQHEVGYRGEEPWNFRLEDVRTIYNGTASEQVSHLRGYDVEYVYVGPTERQRYDNWNLKERLVGVEVAYESEYVTIYRITDDLAVPGTG